MVEVDQTIMKFRGLEKIICQIALPVLFLKYCFKMSSGKRVAFIDLRAKASKGILIINSQFRELNPSVPDLPNRRVSVFEKRLYETETSENFVSSVKRSGVYFSIIN